MGYNYQDGRDLGEFWEFGADFWRAAGVFAEAQALLTALPNSPVFMGFGAGPCVFFSTTAPRGRFPIFGARYLGEFSESGAAISGAAGDRRDTNGLGISMQQSSVFPVFQAKSLR